MGKNNKPGTYIKKEWICAEGVPINHLEKWLNDTIPKKYPEYEVFDILQQMVMPPKEAILSAGPPQPISMAFPLMKIKKPESKDMLYESPSTS